MLITPDKTDFFRDDTLAGGVFGLVIGGTTGAFCGMDQHHDLSGMTLQQKKITIKMEILD